MIPTAAGALLVDPFVVMNTIGLVAFALAGSTKAIRESFDLFGVAVVGLATAFAGGVTRDVLVGRVPLALESSHEIALGGLGVSLALAVSAVVASADEHPIALGADAVGLAAFATAGAIVASEAGISGVGVVAIATINAAGGGAVADILLDRPPFILFEDFYASCAVLGGVAYWTVATAGVGAPGFGVEQSAAAACAGTTLGVRCAAVTYGWSLPTVRTLDADAAASAPESGGCPIDEAGENERE